MMPDRSPGLAAWLLSAVLHLLALLALWWTAAPSSPLPVAPPLAVELWAGGAQSAPSTPAPPPEAPAAPPPPVPTPPPVLPKPVLPKPAAVLPPLVPERADADVKLQDSKPVRQRPPRQPAPEAVPAKPPAKAERARDKPAEAERKAATAAPAAKAPAAKPARSAPARADELLAELDELPSGPGHGKISQAGAKSGSRSGAANGQADLKLQYAEAVRNRVRPYIVIPDGIKGNPEAVIEVIILPTLEIRSTRVLRSSGSPAWDQAVLAALAEVRRFPALPKGAEFTDYRRITLNFRPRE